MSWSFAKLNNKLAEIYFKKGKGDLEIIGHCYVKLSEYKTKQEKRWIESDTKKFQFTYRSGKYKRVQSVV